MKDAFVGVMVLMLLVDLYMRVMDTVPNRATYWLSVGFNAFLLAWGLASVWRSPVVW